MTGTQPSAGLFDGRSAMSWSAVVDAAQRLGERIRSMGVSRVLVVPESGTDLVIALWTAHRCGIDLVVRGPSLPPDSANPLQPDGFLDVASATVTPCKSPGHAGMPATRGVWIFSSGTTGRPTATHWPWPVLTRGVDPWPSVQARSQRWAIGYAPFGFAGITAACQALGLAGYVEFARPEDMASRPDRSDELTVAAGTPSFWRMAVIGLGRGALPLRRVRTVSMGGEAVDDALLDMVRATFRPDRIKQIFGTTEYGTVVATDDGRGGLPVGQRGHRLSTGAAFDVVGDRLVVSTGPGEPFRETGDVVRCEKDRIVFVGRLGLTVNVGGYKVNPVSVSRVLQEHPLVLAARVYGLHNQVLGQVVAADVVLDGRPSTGDIVLELKRFTAARLADHERPRRIRVVDELDLAASGKVAWRG